MAAAKSSIGAGCHRLDAKDTALRHGNAYITNHRKTGFARITNRVATVIDGHVGRNDSSLPWSGGSFKRPRSLPSRPSRTANSASSDSAYGGARSSSR